MTHHKRNLSLRKTGEVNTLRNDSANHFMTSFTGTFLIRSRRIAVEQMRTAVAVSIKFDTERVRELRAVVSQDNSEEFRKKLKTKQKEKPSKDVGHRLRIIVITFKGKLQTGGNKSNGKESSTAGSAYNRVDLNNGRVRMKLHEVIEVRKGTTGTTLGVDLNGARMFTARTKSDLARHINVPCGKETCIDVFIKSTLADHKLSLVVKANMMNRLSFDKKRGNDGVKAFDLCI